ncbi:MAG: S46 family peptidase, partial [Bacteroidetes bacterium]|nr:S46 family peptidase [Bacteroidota bacterium]
MLVFMLVMVAGCSVPKEVAFVTERPPTPTEAETTPPPAVEAPAPENTVQPGRFDGGKMWTFDNPPMAYFEEAYNFQPDSAWFERARLGALRFSTFCSASFVSPRGLVMTNHHCARESLTEVSGEGEDLLNEGFYARALDEERKVEDLYVEQLIAITEVAERVHAASRVVRGDNEKVQARQNKATQIEEQMTSAAQAQDSTRRVEV